MPVSALAGQVTDEATGQGVFPGIVWVPYYWRWEGEEGIQIILKEFYPDGAYLLDLPPGTYTVNFEAPNYTPVVVQDVTAPSYSFGIVYAVMRKNPEPKSMEETLKNLAEPELRKMIKTRLSFYKQVKGDPKQQFTLHWGADTKPALPSHTGKLTVDELKEQIDKIPLIIAALKKLGIDPTKL